MDRGEGLRIAAKLENLGTIREFIRARGLVLEVDPDVVSDLVLAVDEAVTNVIVHGYGGQRDTPGKIELDVDREGMEVVVRIRDEAPAFDPTGVPAPNLAQPLEKRSPGGLGIYLIRQYMDEVNYRTAPDGSNELILKKAMSM
jgi:serine/threonine-protein kinase RsbW